MPQGKTQRQVESEGTYIDLFQQRVSILNLSATGGVHRNQPSRPLPSTSLQPWRRSLSPNLIVGDTNLLIPSERGGVGAPGLQWGVGGVVQVLGKELRFWGNRAPSDASPLNQVARFTTTTTACGTSEGVEKERREQTDRVRADRQVKRGKERADRQG